MTLPISRRSALRLGALATTAPAASVFASQSTAAFAAPAIPSHPATWEITPFGLNQVELAESLFSAKRDRMYGYALGYESGRGELAGVDRMLCNFRAAAGIANPDGIEPPGSWDNETGYLRGHYSGHFLTMLAQAWASTGDEAYLRKLEYFVEGLGECQEALAEAAAEPTPRVQGRDGAAVRLTGSPLGHAEHLALPSGLVDGLTELTVAVWIDLGTVDPDGLPDPSQDPAPLANGVKVFDFGAGGAAHLYLTIRADDEQPYPRFGIVAGGTEQSVTGDAELPTGEWTHLAVTLGGGTAVLYVNGTAAGSADIGLTPADLGAGAANWIGRGQFPQENVQYLNATIDDFGVYDRALDAEEVAALAAGEGEGGGVAWYRFDDEPGPVCADASGNGNDARIAAPTDGDYAREPHYLGDRAPYRYCRKQVIPTTPMGVLALPTATAAGGRHGSYCRWERIALWRWKGGDGIVLTGRRYRLSPSSEQSDAFEAFASACRFVWNCALEQRREYRRKGAWMNYVPQARELAEAKTEHEWLKNPPSHILQQTLRDLDQACRRHGTFGVRWRSLRRWAPSFRFPDSKYMAVERINRKWGRVKLPKLGWVTYRSTRPLGGAVKSATVSFKGGYWWISFLVDDGEKTPKHHAQPGTAVGVDRGVVHAAVTSRGRFHDRSFASEGESKRHKCLQQRLARQQSGSAGRARTLASLRALASRISDRRGDFTAQTAHRLAVCNATVVLEDLKTKNMTSRAAERGVASKSGLNRAILDKGWHRLERALDSKARYTGTRVVKVNPAYTSQTCNACGHRSAKNRESQAVFACRACGHQDNADVNAAKNILKAAGLAVSACGDLDISRSVKQEPAHPQGPVR